MDTEFYNIEFPADNSVTWRIAIKLEKVEYFACVIILVVGERFEGDSMKSSHSISTLFLAGLFLLLAFEGLNSNGAAGLTALIPRLWDLGHMLAIISAVTWFVESALQNWNPLKNSDPMSWQKRTLIVSTLVIPIFACFAVYSYFMIDALELVFLRETEFLHPIKWIRNFIIFSFALCFMLALHNYFGRNHPSDVPPADAEDG
ncbi:MAG: hypothetical protein EP340_04095 [Alphaproteobacteria bacterium]|nr:MAG: hypothetical protein EP340_04095 [Alphaproteobacteria bacterium]